MKLLSRINRNFLITTALLLTVWSVVFYFSLRYVLFSELDDELRSEQEEINYTFQKTGKLPVSQALAGNLVDIRPAGSTENISEQIKDSIIYETFDKDSVPYRVLSFRLAKDNNCCIITVGESQFETEDLITVILIFIFIFVTSLFTVLYFVNRRTSRNTWLPFNQTLEKLKSFDLTRQNKISFAKVGIKEFEELNQSLNQMTERIYRDYNRLKQFTENASHEIQTPLAIIRNTIEMMIQSENLSEEQMNAIQKINEAASRLSKLNTALLTLTKIENQQFTNTEEIELESFVRKKIDDLEEFIQQKKISITVEAHEIAIVKMNPALADLLFDNLISNALKHNVEGGFIKIIIRSYQFTIVNSGEPLTVEPEKLFNRFVKNNPTSDSLGLGLAMVKQICLSYHFKISFSSEKKIHTIVILF